MEKNNVVKLCATFLLATLIVIVLATVKTGVAQYYSGTTLHNEQIQVYFVDEAVSVANYTDDTHEPTGWELFPSIFWDSNKNGMLEADESIGHALSPCVHFTHAGQTHHFWPLHQSIMQDPGDPHIISSGWINPDTYASEVEDTDQLITIECTITVLDGNNYFTQEINITSTASSTLTDVNLIIYIGFDINGPFDDYAFVDSSCNNMLKAYDNETGVWFGAFPGIHANNFEVSEWNDGPYEGDDLWQHTLNNGLDGTTASSGDVEGALKFHLYQIQPGESKNLTIHYSLGMNESDLYAPIVPGHDVAVTNVTPSRTVVGQGYNIPINATVENQGTFDETFNVTTYWNTTEIETKEVTLTSGNSTSVPFYWNTSGLTKYVNYTISAYAHPVPGETDTADNTFVDGIILMVHIGDVNGDGKVRVDDILAIALAFGSEPGHPRWNPNYDINCDGKIRVDDILATALNFGWG